MSQPTAYSRQANFTDFSANYPTAPQPGASLDSEFNAAKVTLDGILRSLALIQRDDGALKNNLVTLDSLTPEVMLALGAGVIWLPRGEWVTATAYAISDVIKSGTASYVCSVAHTSAADFDDDFDDGRWILLFDSGGTVPADGSVTTIKLADGAVTDDKIGFSELDLGGNIRGGAGIQAGTAPLGGLMHAKAAAGNVLAKFERTTDAQGRVGYQIIGVTVTWEVSQPASGATLDIIRAGVTVGSFTANAGLDMAGALRATTGVVPAAGAGVGLHYAASVGHLSAYDYSLGAWKDIKVRGLKTYLTAGAVDVVEVISTGVNVSGHMRRGGVDLGWLDTPQNPQSAAYTLALTDRGAHVYSANVAGQTIVLPINAVVAFPVGATIAIVNDGTNPITLSTAGVTVKLAGGALTGDRTIAANGLATLIKVGTDRWFITGMGVS